MKQLTREDILVMQQHIIDRYGGTPGVRDENQLDLALNGPYQELGGYELFPSVTEKAVRLCYGLVKNHPFADGNKRTAAMALLVMLELNGMSLRMVDNELAGVIQRLAAGSITDQNLLKWVQSRQD